MKSKSITSTIMLLLVSLLFLGTSCYHKKKDNTYTFGFAYLSTMDDSDDVLTCTPTSGYCKNIPVLVDGESRFYSYYLGQGSDEGKAPLVFLLHGHGGDPDSMTGASGVTAPYSVWLDIADAYDLMLVFPIGLTGTDGKTSWNDCRADNQVNTKTDDIAYLDAVMEDMMDRFTIDSSRIYMSGTSNGAMMTLRYAIDRPTKIAAAASIIGSMPVLSECDDPTVPVPMLFMNGTDDPILPYNGGYMEDDPDSGRGSVQSTPSSVDIWIEANGASTTPDETNFSDIDDEDESTVIRYVYSGGTDGADVSFYQIAGGGHTEPSIQERYSSGVIDITGEQNGDIEMATEVWEFFKDKKLDN